jgi:hypothetical protein
MPNMRNVAHRHRRAARKLGALGPVKKAYVVLDSDHRPDLRSEFAGSKVKIIGGQHVVMLDDATARFYLDSGSIELLNKPVKEETSKEEVTQ